MAEQFGEQHVHWRQRQTQEQRLAQSRHVPPGQCGRQPETARPPRTAAERRHTQAGGGKGAHAQQQEPR
eukprot:8468655-Pyramimonas_sp.AAC.1